MPISPIQALILLAVVLLVFGPKRLPELTRSIATSIKEFRKATAEDDQSPEGSDDGA